MEQLSSRAIALREWFASRAAWPAAVLPDYDGGSVGNLAASVLSGFGVVYDSSELLPTIRANSLPPELLDGARVVVLIVLDGLSAAVYERQRALGRIAGLGALDHQVRLTSVFPSSTSAALTSVQVGVAPARHGIVGYTLYLPAFDRVVNMIHFKPVDGGAFNRPPPDPTRYLPVARIYERLATAGIESVVVSHSQYAGSPLTRVHSAETRYAGHQTLADFAWLLQREVARPGRRFVFGYWAGVDILGHRDGPDALSCALELQLISSALDDGLLAPLAKRRDDVAVIVTADHGQMALDAKRVVSLAAFNRRGGWRHPQTGERRAVGLAPRTAAAQAEIAPTIRDSGVMLPVADAFDAGLYGPAPIHPEARERVGDVLVLAKDGTSYPYRPLREGEELMLGSHGSLSPQEMLVPLLAHRFRP